MAQRVSTKPARDNFSDLLNRVYYQREPFIVERQGKTMAVVINPEECEQYQKLQKEQLFQIVHAIHERTSDKDPDEMYRDVTATVEDVRQEAYEAQLGAAL